MSQTNDQDNTFSEFTNEQVADLTPEEIEEILDEVTEILFEASQEQLDAVDEETNNRDQARW